LGDDVDENKVAQMLSLMTSETKKTKKTKKPKREKMDGEPNRPTTSYMRWLAENRASIKSGLEESAETEDPVRAKHVTKKAGALWKALSDDDKEPYIAAYKAEKVDFDAWFDAWCDANGRPQRSASPKREKFDPTLDDTDCPDGWSGPFVSKYLHGLAVGRKFGQGYFHTLDEASAAADALGEKCGGVTKMSYGYALSLGGDPLAVDLISKQYITCWTKDNFAGETWESTRSRSPSPKAASVANTDDDEPEVASAASPKKMKKMKKLKKTEPEPEPEPESDDDESDDESDDEVSVEPWTHKGDTYLLDPMTGVVYNYDTQEPVGKKTAKGHFVATN
jgi:hypothetical protein